LNRRPKVMKLVMSWSWWNSNQFTKVVHWEKKKTS